MKEKREGGGNFIANDGGGDLARGYTILTGGRGGGK